MAHMSQRLPPARYSVVLAGIYCYCQLFLEAAGRVSAHARGEPLLASTAKVYSCPTRHFQRRNHDS